MDKEDIVIDAFFTLAFVSSGLFLIINAVISILRSLC